jgi:tetratricopeptide (TPR) repeat protein
MNTPTVAQPLPRPTPGRRIAAAVGVIVLGTLAAYHNTFRVPFLFDDARAILENPGIRRLWPLWNAFWPLSADLTVSGRPVAHLTLAINYALSGTGVWSYHALNLLIHVLSGLTLFGVVRRTLLRPVLQARFGRDALWLAAAIALLWTLHPLQTEAVTYVIQRVESLMGLFYLLTLYCFIRGAENEVNNAHFGTTKTPRHKEGRKNVRGFFVSWRLRGSESTGASWYVLAFLACLLGMATKEVMATAPVLVLLYDRTFVAGSFHEAWRRRRWLHLGLAATWLPLAGLVASTGWNRGATAGFNVGVTPWAYWQTQFEAVARYLGLAVWPHPLVFEYGALWGYHAGEVVRYALVVIPLAAAAGWALWRRPRTGFLGACFFAILAPTSVVPGTIQMIVEHRMYLSLAAVITAAVLGIYAAAGRRSWLAFAVLALGLAIVTERRNDDYRSDLALWSDTVAKRPDNPRARSGLGLALDHAGRLAGAVQQFEAALRLSPGDVEIRDNLGVTLEHMGRITEAIQHYETALRLKPSFPEAHCNLGNALLRTGKIAEAIGQYEEALRLRPDFAEVRYNLGGALDQAGRTAEAIRQYEAALRLNPDHAEAHNNFGNLLRRLGRTSEARQQYEAALRAQPDLARAHHNLAVIFEESGRLPEAIRQYEAALQAQPDLAPAQNNLGVLLCRSGRVAEGLAHLQEAVRLTPDFARAHFNLGVALAQVERLPEAIQQYTEALRLQPSLAEAHNNLGMVLGQSGRIPEAIAELSEALRLRPDYAEAHTNLGNALLADGRWDAAIAEYEEVLRLRPDDAAARAGLERAHAAQTSALVP